MVEAKFRNLKISFVRNEMGSFYATTAKKQYQQMSALKPKGQSCGRAIL